MTIIFTKPTLFVIKRKHSSTYYTIKSEGKESVPSIVAFVEKSKANQMHGMIKSFETHQQPLVVEKISEAYLMRVCTQSLQPVIVFDKNNITWTLDTSIENVGDVDSIAFYLENKYLYG